MNQLFTGWECTAEDCKKSWSGQKNGQLFKCAFCGIKFQPGDTVRSVYTNNLKSGTYKGNPLVCKSCDNETIIETWKAKCDSIYSENNWFLNERR